MREFLALIDFLDDNQKRQLLKYYEALEQRYLTFIEQETINALDFIELKALELTLNAINSIIKSQAPIAEKLIQLEQFMKKRWENPITFSYPFITINQFCFSLAKLLQLNIKLKDITSKIKAFQILYPIKYARNLLDEDEDIDE